ncbi:hypothetical protein ACCS67_11715 [Rhizobium brockwellii]|uniref:hypothetical protein n=1 Tax=Rhizobium brockwellii TaxID=3019932 RepID=UPI003F9DF468
MAVENSLNGFYTAYFTGSAGNSMGMFIFLNGIITGADVGGGRYDGKYRYSVDGTRIVAEIQFSLPIGNLSITGIAAEAAPISVEMALELPVEFNAHDVHRLETPLGPINAKLEKIRGM